MVILRSLKLDFVRAIDITNGRLTYNSICLFTDTKCKFKIYIALAKGPKSIASFGLNLNNFF